MSVFEWTPEQKKAWKAKMIEKYGSEEAWNKAQSERAKLPRKRKKK